MVQVGSIMNGQRGRKHIHPGPAGRVGEYRGCRRVVGRIHEEARHSRPGAINGSVARLDAEMVPRVVQQPAQAPQCCIFSCRHAAGADDTRRVESRHRVRLEIIREHGRIGVGAVGDDGIGCQRSDRGAVCRRQDNRHRRRVIGGVHEESCRGRPRAFDQPVVGLRPPVIQPVLLEVFGNRP